MDTVSMDRVNHWKNKVNWMYFTVFEDYWEYEIINSENEALTIILTQAYEFTTSDRMGFMIYRAMELMGIVIKDGTTAKVWEEWAASANNLF